MTAFYPHRLFLCASVVLVAGRIAHGFNLGGTPRQQSKSNVVDSRRTFISSLVAGGLVAGTSLIANPSPSMAADGGEEDIEVYFGCGCFWHVQHEFVEAERRILGRTNDMTLTSRAGYAGGKAGAKDGKVCYHNGARIADYGSLGHAEVVRLKIPPSSFKDFAEEYCKLFDAQGNRADQGGDKGLEYRNLVGVPGGNQSIYAQQLVEASKAMGDKLDFAKGKGDDPDARATTFVMDTANFPFFVGEQYHQFHDGFKFGENYPDSYNNIANKLAKEGTLGVSNCPNGLLGIGALGL